MEAGNQEEKKKVKYCFQQNFFDPIETHVSRDIISKNHAKLSHGFSNSSCHSVCLVAWKLLFNVDGFDQ